MIQIDDTNLPNLTKNNLVVNPLPTIEQPINKHSSFKNVNIPVKSNNNSNYHGSEHRDRHKDCIIPVHKTFLLYSIIQFLELIFINKRANQIGITPKELKPSQYLSTKNINTLISSPLLLHSLCKFTQCQIAEITYRVKVFDKFRNELTKYQMMIDNASSYDTDILNLQSEQVEQWLKIAFDGYSWWDKKKSNNSKKMNQSDITMCNIRLKNILKNRKRMETIKKKREFLPQNFRFIPYNRSESK
ncbi:hypothetical protein RclHR1_02030004 [Rhizophagus clarus]|uniref:Uncharacterized protein n=1 Tax=Rhizophagus clarus TaxID=94130 RepID=A0A2Z6R6K2_9GLOM|nr:hypothetical protein RclHR1_02030004 [Rhizophagus clarus]GES98169.1 hypothetical protein GLOIN_2v1761140 [Rhizophagus clarus]